MEDGEIIFRAKMPGGAVESRVFPNIKAFHDEMVEEGKRWQDFPTFGNRIHRSHHLWTPQAAHISFVEQTKVSPASALAITKSIDAYYSKVESWNACYFPSWTTAGRVLLEHRDDVEFLDGFAQGFLRGEGQISSGYTYSSIGGIASAYAFRAGFSTSSPENALDEMKAIRTLHARLMEEAVASKERMEKLYNEKLHLEAAVTYWGKVAVKHESKQRFWMRQVVEWSVLSLISLAGYLGYGRLFFTETIKIFGTEEPWAFVCAFLILASFVYWIIRFVVSQYNQHNHLATDARERETMAETFLALVNDEKAKGTVTEKDHLGLVLAALFRPSAIGGCENGPVPFYEVVANVLNKKGS